MASENEMEFDDHENCDIEDENELQECDTDSDIELEEICPLRDDAKIIYQGHSSAILCVELDEKHNVVYTGGLDDKVMIWEMNSGKMISMLDSHTESVTHISVNGDGSIVASGDIGGRVIMWRRLGNEQHWDKVQDIETATVVGLAWSKEFLYVCDVVGTLQSWSNAAPEQGAVMYKYGKGCSCSKFALVLDDVWSAVLYGESCGEHENCGNTSSLHLSHNGTERSVKFDLRHTIGSNTAICEEEDAVDEGLGAAWANKKTGQTNMLAIGDWGQLILASVSCQGYSAQCKLTKVEVKGGGLVDQAAFSSVLPYVAFSTKNGIISVFDLSKQVLRYTWVYSETMPAELRTADGEDEVFRGVSQLCWSPSKPVFYTAGLDGRLCEWDGRTAPGKEVPTLWGYSGIVWDMKVSKDGSAVVIVSEDKVGRVFAV